MSSPRASLSLSSILARVMSYSLGAVWPTGITFRRTIVPRLPRISFTTSFRFMSTTSTISPSVPCPTPMTRSFFLSRPSRSAAPPGTISATVVYPSSALSEAPMPSSWRRMPISKFSSVPGDMKLVWGSRELVRLVR